MRIDHCVVAVVKYVENERDLDAAQWAGRFALRRDGDIFVQARHCYESLMGLRNTQPNERFGFMLVTGVQDGHTSLQPITRLSDDLDGATLWVVKLKVDG